MLNEIFPMGTHSDKNTARLPAHTLTEALLCCLQSYMHVKVRNNQNVFPPSQPVVTKSVPPKPNIRIYIQHMHASPTGSYQCGQLAFKFPLCYFKWFPQCLTQCFNLKSQYAS